jgi:two-component system nitrate/nitrite response regulator NarL
MTELRALGGPKLSCLDLHAFSSSKSDSPGDGHATTGEPANDPALAGVKAASPSEHRNDRPVTAVIIDKSVVFRVGLRHILGGRRFRVTVECSCLSDLSEQALGDRSCVVLLGLDRDTQAALPEITALKQKHRGLRMIALSEQFHPDQLLAMIEAGADGYLLKNDITPDALLKSVELVLVDGIVVPQGFARLLNNRSQVLLNDTPPVPALELPAEDRQPEPASDAAPADEIGRLSSREHLVLMHLTRGDSNKSIARGLNIAEATVKVHVKSLLRKIRVCNRTQAAMWAMTHRGGRPNSDRPISGISA